MKRWLGSVVCIAWLVGCGSSGGGGTGQGGGGIGGGTGNRGSGGGTSQPNTPPNNPSFPDDPGPTRTVRQRCEAVATAICDRWRACGAVTGSAATECNTVLVDNCCSLDCVESDPYPTASVDLCTSDMTKRTCTYINGDSQRRGIPTTCDGLF